MIATLRTMTYSQLLSSVAGRRVAIWSCNTCARLCGLGGREAVEGLASRLRSDGVEVVRTDLVSASCLLERVRQTWEGEGDIIIPLACTEGIRVLRQVSGAKVLETCRTVGLGVHAGGRCG